VEKAWMQASDEKRVSSWTEKASQLAMELPIRSLMMVPRAEQEHRGNVLNCFVS